MERSSDENTSNALKAIDAALPAEPRPALSLLLTASAAKAVEVGLTDVRAIDHFITALKAVRKRLSRERLN